MVKLGNRILEVPLIQGGMGVGISLGHLAGHVMKEGAMGTISAAHPGWQDPGFWQHPVRSNLEALKQEIKKARAIAQDKGLLAVNVMCASKDYDQYVSAALENGADAIVCGAGLPLHLPRLAQGYDVLLAPVVSSLKALELLCRVWQKKYQRMPDFIVVEGSQAGGHLGFSHEELTARTAPSLTDILQEILDWLAAQDLKIPVFAGGSVPDKASAHALMNLGAAGIQAATPFIAARECDASPVLQKVLLECGDEDVVLIQSPAGYWGRAIRTPLIEKLEQGPVPIHHCIQCMDKCSAAKAGFCISEALIAAVSGDQENGLFFCGANAPAITEIRSVQEIIEDLI